MGKRHVVYAGLYRPPNSMSISSARNHTEDIPSLTQLIAPYFWTAYYSINGNHMAIMTVCIIVLLSFILPDISQKIHRTNELKAMKKALQDMSNNVSKAEVACFTAIDKISDVHMQDDTTDTTKEKKDLAMCTSDNLYMPTTQSAPAQFEKKLGFFRRIFFHNKHTSNKEVTLMSFLYTDSFDAFKKKPKENSLQAA